MLAIHCGIYVRRAGAPPLRNPEASSSPNHVTAAATGRAHDQQRRRPGENRGGHGGVHPRAMDTALTLPARG
jgi:hypothetical protein